MRDHLLGHPGAARAVERVLEPDEFDTWSEVYGVGVPLRVMAEILCEAVPKGWEAEAARRAANRKFTSGNHRNPDGSVTPVPVKLRDCVETRTALGNIVRTSRVAQQAAAALAAPLKARTAAQAADRMAEAFAHAEAARGED